MTPFRVVRSAPTRGQYNPMYPSSRTTYENSIPTNLVVALTASLLAVAAYLTTADGELRADEPQSSRVGNYLIVPVSTELQRYYFRDYKDVSAFVYVNAMDPINLDATVLDAGAVDFDGLQESLAPYTESVPPGKVVFAVRARRKPERLPAAGVLSRALGQFAREIGLSDSEVDFRRYSDSGPAGSKYFNNWEKLVEDLRRSPAAGEIEAEVGIGDQDVKLFAVRTPLSRALYGGEYGIEADCVAFIIPPIEEVDMSKVSARMQAAVGQLKLNDKSRILLKYHSQDWNSAETRVAFEELTAERLWKDLLGFETAAFASWRQPPMQALETHRAGAREQ